MKLNPEEKEGRENEGSPENGRTEKETKNKTERKDSTSRPNSISRITSRKRDQLELDKPATNSQNRNRRDNPLTNTTRAGNESVKSVSSLGLTNTTGTGNSLTNTTGSPVKPFKPVNDSVTSSRDSLSGSSGSTLLTLYNGPVPAVSRMMDYQSLVLRRRAVYSYIERYKQLPVSAVLSRSTVQDDLRMHYSSKLSAGTSREAGDEFVIGETSIFMQRIRNSSADEVVRLFISEYLSFLTLPFTYVVDRDTLTVRIDSTDGLNYIGMNRGQESISSEILRLYVVNRYNLSVYCHFTKYYSVPEKITNGFVISGLDGIKSILIRSMHDTLRNSVDSLYVSGVPKQYSVSRSVISVEKMSLQMEKVPMCIYQVLEKLKKKGHLKYDDRSNLNNFLKSVGVPVEEAISLYREYFRCSLSEFDKKYKYSIQHGYGLVGARINYKRNLCSKFIGETGKGECTGCPHAGKKDPQRECTYLLEKTTGKSEKPIISPAEYYLAAVGRPARG